MWSLTWSVLAFSLLSIVTGGRGWWQVNLYTKGSIRLKAHCSSDIHFCLWINAHWKSFFISVTVYRYSDVITAAKAALITRQKIIISVICHALMKLKVIENYCNMTNRAYSHPTTTIVSNVPLFFFKYWTLEIAVMGHWRSWEIWPACIPVWFFYYYIGS